MSTRPAGLFITGTDTGIGKTVATAFLLALLRERGLDAVPMKPVQTGCPGDPAHPEIPDLETCFHVAGLPSLPDERLQMSPYTFATPCSPHLAAELEGRAVDPDEIQRAWRALQNRHEYVLAEGAGGLLVPLTRRYLTADLIADLGVPALVVARPVLGTLNHTLLTLAELRRRRIPVAGVVLVRSDPASPTDLEDDNKRTIADTGDTGVYGPVPWLPELRWSSCASRVRPILDPLAEALLRRARH